MRTTPIQGDGLGSAAPVRSNTETFRSRALAIAERAFLSRSFAAVTVDEIVAELQTSKRTIYETFGSKAGLVDAVVSAIDARLESIAHRVFHDSSLSVPEQLHRIALEQSQATEGLSPERVSELRHRFPSAWQIFDQGRARRVSVFYRPLIERGVRTGAFCPDYGADFLIEVYLELSALIITSAIVERTGMTSRQALQKVITLFLRGAAPEES